MELQLEDRETTHAELEAQPSKCLRLKNRTRDLSASLYRSPFRVKL
jgi:hypothetical protein